MEPGDIELMLRVQAGETAAFERLAHRYREPLRRYFAALSGDRAPADDLAQETLLRLWLSRERYEPAGRFSSYLFGIARHQWLNYRKRLKHRSKLAGPSLDEEGALAAAALRVSQPERVLMERYFAKRIRQAVAALPPPYRAVFELCQFEGLKYAEAADRLAIPLGTVKSRMAEALRRLREQLTQETD
jgi:RNA polymerase sigma-70 factor, ECF subfamily